MSDGVTIDVREVQKLARDLNLKNARVALEAAEVVKEAGQFTRDEARRMAAFGLHEVFQIARCYTSLGDAPLRCGLVDDPGRPEYRAYGLPVLKVRDQLLILPIIYLHKREEKALARAARPAAPALGVSGCADRVGWFMRPFPATQ